MSIEYLLVVSLAIEFSLVRLKVVDFLYLFFLSIVTIEHVMILLFELVHYNVIWNRVGEVSVQLVDDVELRRDNKIPAEHKIFQKFV